MKPSIKDRRFNEAGLSMKNNLFIGFYIIAAVVLFTMTPCRAANHAILIGVGQYSQLDRHMQLEGPPRDAAALEGVLKAAWGFDKKNVITLINEKATKRKILGALTDLGERSAPGDFLFIYFSGHGTSSYDPKTKMLGLDPFTGALVPADFKQGTHAESRERLIIGKRDLRPILSKLEADRQVLVIIDACYSGCTVRGDRAPGRAKHLPLTWDDLESDQPDAYGAGTLKEPPYPYKNVIYISASSNREQAVDIPTEYIQGGYATFDGRPHGALTDTLLHGLCGDADMNNNSLVSFNELYQYVRMSVTANFAQTPQLLFDRENRKLLEQPVFNQPVSRRGHDLTKPDEQLKVKLEGFDKSAERRISELEGVKVVDEGFDLLAVLNRGKYSLYQANGRLAAEYSSSGFNKLVRRLAGQVEIKKLVGMKFREQEFNVAIELENRRGVLVEGEPVGFRLYSEAACYFLLLDVDSAGMVNVIYPATEDEIALSPAKQEIFLQDIGEVAPAFGIDHVKLFGFKNRPVGLERFLGKSFQPDSMLFKALMELLNAGSGMAQATVQVRTCSKADLIQRR